jgi:V8-like Glu-specific endopeptidase
MSGWSASRQWAMVTLWTMVFTMGVAVAVPAQAVRSSSRHHAARGHRSTQANPRAQLSISGASKGHHAASAADYWTRARMADADRRSGQLAKPKGVKAKGKAPAPAAMLSRDGGAEPPAQVPYAIAPESSTGKLYGVMPNGGNYRCTASVVTSPQGNMLLTAGHCIYQGGWAHDVIFIPAYNYNNRPYGTWSVNWATTTAAWTTASDFREDFALLKVSPLNNQQIQSVVGSNGIVWNRSDYFSGESLGYQDNVAGGEAVSYCRDDFYTFNLDSSGGVSGPHQLVRHCATYHGASGGPIFRWEQGVRWVTTITSQSTYLRDGTPVNASPYFGENFGNLYRGAI